VALSIASRRPAVSRHPALWSPDFPPRTCSCARRLSGQLQRESNMRNSKNVREPGFWFRHNALRALAYTATSSLTRPCCPPRTCSCARRLSGQLRCGVYHGNPGERRETRTLVATPRTMRHQSSITCRLICNSFHCSTSSCNAVSVSGFWASQPFSGNTR